MNKVELNKIEPGDLVKFEYQTMDIPSELGLVTEVEHDGMLITAIWADTSMEETIHCYPGYLPIAGHWKVINFNKGEN
jgi:hypothetical protein